MADRPGNTSKRKTEVSGEVPGRTRPSSEGGNPSALATPFVILSSSFFSLLIKVGWTHPT